MISFWLHTSTLVNQIKNYIDLLLDGSTIICINQNKILYGLFQVNYTAVQKSGFEQVLLTTLDKNVADY